MAGKSNQEGASEVSKTTTQKLADEKLTTAWFIPVITAGTLAVAFFVYYFVYVGARREYLANRNFRSLALLGEQFQQSVSIHGNILDFCADLLALKKQAAHVEKLAPDSFLLVRDEDEKLPEADKEREALKDYLKFLAPSLELSEVPGETPSGTGLRVERRNDRWGTGAAIVSRLPGLAQA